ncbi:type II toxin-antitoxin system RelE/ParE family toxin [Algoriphagus sp. D3-2-R+10]|uniref:type II toxin-antitoxin system RelE/ParE family toxin n=1 Tax=Algoriphagus aurantiacus TaxID=3103948 RepID=UPI002B3F667C|nr:type II toxin-antitoxin system RelE/ParE family toxin [Algoriphagus sp. D3-2-R+10]MEB2774921.1 type II toxin-antitoxin system RelE/ParE family toxin [Algoriphagus sp. D3-2-R+10]
MNPIPINWSNEALQSLTDCVDFLEKAWNEKIIDDFLRLLDEKVYLISLNPRIGEKVFYTDFRKALVHKNVSIYYKESYQEIKILLVWDNRQNPENLYKKLASI